MTKPAHAALIPRRRGGKDQRYPRIMNIIKNAKAIEVMRGWFGKGDTMLYFIVGARGSAPSTITIILSHHLGTLAFLLA
jgi:hypothetical protein